MKRLGLVALVMAEMAAGISCGPAANLLPVNDLNRPTDVAFMCFGAFPQAGSASDGGATGGSGGTLQVSGRPLRACHPQDQYDPGPTTTTRTFALMPNSATGTLSAVDADHWKLADLDPDTAGYGTVPLGQDPEQISVSDDGCRLISANRGSCDLTVVDPSILVAPMLNDENGGNVLLPPGPTAPSQTFRPLKGDGTPLLAPPYEAVFLPQDTSSLLSYPTGDPNNPFQSTPKAGSKLPLLPAQNQLCGDAPTVDPANWPAQPAPKSWYVLVTYPSCDLIAMVALPSGKIVSSAKVKAVQTANGESVTLEDAGTSPSCPVSSCAGQVLPPATASAGIDAAAGDGAPTVRAPASDGGALDMGGASGGSAGAGGASGTAGATGAGGATGGMAGALLGNQYPNVPYVGSPIGPSGIAIRPDLSRAYISLANASYVLSVGLSSSGLEVPGFAIYLNEGARGSTRVRLSVDPTHQVQPGVAGAFVGADPATVAEDTTDQARMPSPNYHGLDAERKYLYAIARDGTLRVISVFLPGQESECETNADPLHLPPNVTASTQCIGVDPKIRRPFSVGPGIHFPSLPIDVAAADIQRYPQDTGEESLNGAHAWVVTDSGTVYLVNINPVLRDYLAVTSASTPPFVSAPVPEAPPFVNTLRDKNQISFSVVLDSASGPPRVDVLPSIPPTGPYIEPFYTQGSFLNPTATSVLYVQTIAFFPQGPPPPNSADPTDRRAITPQTWTVTWEGALGGQRSTGNMLPAGNFSMFQGDKSGFNSAIDSVFEDGGANYCASGVVKGDLVTLTGCTNNAQCGLGEQCILGNTAATGAAGLAVNGLCVDPNQESTKQNDCGEFLNSVRRYQVVEATEDALVVQPNLDEIVISPLEPDCHPGPRSGADGGVDAGVDAGADGGAGQADTCPDANDPTTAKFTCESTYPGGGTRPRCLMLCHADSDCRSGRNCVDFDHGDPSACADPNKRCYCAEAPVFDSNGKKCFDQLISYQLSAGKTFVVTGSQAGIVTTAQLPSSPGGACSDNPTPDARFSFRIPMDAPACTNVPSSVATIDGRIDPDTFGTDPNDPQQMALRAAAVTNAKALEGVATSTPSSDPCLYLGGPVAGDPPTTLTADGGVSAPAGATGLTHVRALFQNSQLNFVLANLDRSPTFQTVTSFDVHGGFVPQTVFDPTTIEVSMPARIVVGPVDSLSQVLSGTTSPQYEAPYLFVVDQRRLGLSQGGGPTRGQLLRINPYTYNVAIGVAPTSYLPIFEDYNASGGLFPIQ